MNIHEHQAKELLRRYGVATLEGQACFSVDETVVAAERLGFPCAVKAQIHAGGRGKAGGVKIVKSAAEVRAAYQARRLCFALGLGGKEQLPKAVAFLTALARAFVDLDASLVEVNPLVVTKAGDVVALDAKMGFDDNALFRHADVKALRDQ